jgi:hypothetical protein
MFGSSNIPATLSIMVNDDATLVNNDIAIPSYISSAETNDSMPG